MLYSLFYKPVTSTFILMHCSNGGIRVACSSLFVAWREANKIDFKSGLLDKSPNGQKSDEHEDVHHGGKARAGRVWDGVENLIVHLYLFLVLSQRLLEKYIPDPFPRVFALRSDVTACVNSKGQNCQRKRMKLLLGFWLLSWPHPLLSSFTAW